MKALTIIAASLALALAGCHRDQSAAGGATGQKSEGSKDATGAPKRPSSPTAPAGGK